MKVQTYTSCPICGGQAYIANNQRVYLSSWFFKSYTCTSCNHYFRFPSPPKDILSDYYSLKASTRYPDDINKRIAKLQYDYITSALAAYSNLDLCELSVVEIGSGLGWLSQNFCSIAKQVRAYEPDVETVREAHFLGHSHVVCDFYDPTKLATTNSADSTATLYILSHVLEHLIDPHAFLNSLCGRSRTFLFIEVPIAELESFAYAHSYVDINSDSEHLHSFTVTSLSYLLTSNKWNVYDFSQVGNRHFFITRNLTIRAKLYFKQARVCKNRVKLHLSFFSFQAFINTPFLIAVMVCTFCVGVFYKVLAKCVFLVFGSKMKRVDYPSQRIFASNF